MTAYSKICECCESNFSTRYRNQRFCSRSCSNVTIKRREKKSVICFHPECSNEVSYHANKYCRDCVNIGRHLRQSGKPYAELTVSDLTVRSGSNKFDSIRADARKRTDTNLPCSECGWVYHVEVCHIKPIRSFKPTDLISTINGPDNIKLLCPNCHWLFDHKNDGTPNGT